MLYFLKLNQGQVDVSFFEIDVIYFFEMFSFFKNRPIWMLNIFEIDVKFLSISFFFRNRC